MTTGILVLLVICLVLAFLFEFVNGFHDTANAVATVIYTNSLKPTFAVIWSGLWNFLGVIVGGVGVAMGIVNLLPIDALIDPNLNHGIAMILALLLSAIIWNLGTWYVGLPASSSHTLIGSILGIGIAFLFINGKDAVNWGKAEEIGLALLLSPLFGFAMAIFVMYGFKRFIKNDYIFKEPIPGKTPPLWIRTILTLTCTLVSFFHGSNDGQKGIGLMMLILIVFMPGKYVVDERVDPSATYAEVYLVNYNLQKVDATRLQEKDKAPFEKMKSSVAKLLEVTKGAKNYNELSDNNRFEVRKNLITMSKSFEKLQDNHNLSLTQNELKDTKKYIDMSKWATDYAPDWVKIMISIALGLGTMVGWKRIVKTVGEKIGKQHMSYAQGAAAELVAASTIGLSTGFKLPVSTTHVLSSGIAGSMVAKKGLKNLQKNTIKNILIAWVLTLPVTIILSCSLFLLFRWLLG